jgi:lipopolysaccharide transport system permease protein/teichoic acid transport system permease protein
MMRFGRKLWQYRTTLSLLVVRDIQNRFVGSLGGMVWTVLHPLLLVATYSLIFSHVFGRTMRDVPFAIWLFSALLPWITFNEALRSATNCLQRYHNLIKKTPLPSELLVLVPIGAAGITHAVGLCVLIVLILGFGPSLTPTALLIPGYLVCLGLLCLGLGWLLASLNVFFRDVFQILNVILNVWFYLTPIIYPLKVLPESYRVWMAWNPMFFITEGYRLSLLYGEHPPWSVAGPFCLWSLIFLGVGGMLFRRLKRHFPEVL